MEKTIEQLIDERGLLPLFEALVSYSYAKFTKNYQYEDGVDEYWGKVYEIVSSAETAIEQLNKETSAEVFEKTIAER